MSKSLAISSLFLTAILLAGQANATTCSAYPNNLTNGSTADASQVMGNFSSIMTCANSSLAPLAGPLFTGNVGINMPSPSDRLDIQDSNFPRIGLLRTGIGTWYVGGNGTTNLFTVSLNAIAPFIALDSGGNLGIDTTSPSYPLHVNGTAYATGAAGALSDRRHKRDIAPLADDALSVVAALKPVTFFWKDPSDDGMKGRQIGFIAQDVLPVLPDVVLKMNNAEGTLGLKYDAFIPVLTKAIQEQQAQINTLTSANQAQASVIEQLQEQVAALMRANKVRTAER